MKKTQSKRLSDEAEIDSIDSLICACGIPMLMTFSHVRAVILCQCGGITSTESRRKMAYIKGGKPRNGNETSG
jgi:hypothetical protein